MIYVRYAKDLSEDLFNSVYADLYAIAVRENKSLYDASKRKHKKVNVYRPDNAQETLNAFCTNKLSLGEAMDYIQIEKIYHPINV